MEVKDHHMLSKGILATFFAVVFISCTQTVSAEKRELLCLQNEYDIGSGKISIRLYGGEREVEIESLDAEVSYGVNPVDAKYIESSSRFILNLLANDSFSECVITIDKLSGAAQQSCFGRPSEFPKDIRANTFEFNCKV
jgi:hypothetical protein